MVKWLDVAFVTQCVMMCYDVLQCVLKDELGGCGDECSQGMGTANEGLARTELN